MTNIYIRKPTIEDKTSFLATMQRSKEIHHPWVQAPTTPHQFDEFIQRYQQPNQQSFLVCTETENIVGIFNISEIIRGSFQNAYLGFYATSDFAGMGYMSAGLKLVLEKVFKELKLHRLEANIQPENTRSIQLVKRNGFRYEGFSPRYLKINEEWRGHEHWAMTLEDYIKNDPSILQKDQVNIVSYNPDWPTMAALEIAKLQDVLQSTKIIDIQHVGSTAIPGISAKPIIDIQVAVHSLEEVKNQIIPELQKLGYEFWNENPDITKMFFVKGMPPFGNGRTHHVHVFAYDSEHWRNKIIFRDYLCRHPETAREYEQLKKQLADDFSHDREKYTDAKRVFVDKILKLARNRDK